MGFLKSARENNWQNDTLNMYKAQICERKRLFALSEKLFL